MDDQIDLRRCTKDQLTEIKKTEGHTNFDSVVKLLLRDHDVVSKLLSGSQSQPQVFDSRSAIGSTWGAEAYVGAVGTGKSHTTKYHAHALLTEPVTADVYFIDSENEYRNIAEQLDTPVVTATPDSPLNPFDFRHSVMNSVAIDDAIAYKSHMISLLLDSLSELRGGNAIQNQTELSDGVHAAVIHEATHRVLDSVGMPGTADIRPSDRLSLETLHEEVAALQSLSEPMCTAPQYDVIDFTEAAEVVVDVLREISGMDCVTGLESDSRYVVGESNSLYFNVSEHGGDSGFDVQEAMVSCVLTAVEIAKTTEGPSVIFVDDANPLINNWWSREVLQESMKIASQYDISIRATLQTPEDLLNVSETGVCTFWNRIHFHRCDGITDIIADAYDLSTGQKSFIAAASTGSGNDHVEMLTCDLADDVKSVEVIRPDFETSSGV